MDGFPHVYHLHALVVKWIILKAAAKAMAGWPPMNPPGGEAFLDMWPPG
jgi:hypothetical protein